MDADYKSIGLAGLGYAIRYLPEIEALVRRAFDSGELAPIATEVAASLGEVSRSRAAVEELRKSAEG